MKIRITFLLVLAMTIMMTMTAMNILGAAFSMEIMMIIDHFQRDNDDDCDEHLEGSLQGNYDD